MTRVMAAQAPPAKHCSRIRTNNGRSCWLASPCVQQWLWGILVCNSIPAYVDGCPVAASTVWTRYSLCNTIKGR
jgi:hypothetical protein